jgi:hypothetical protein
MYREVTAHVQTINDEERSYGTFAYTVDRVRLIADYLKDYIEEVVLGDTSNLNLIQQDLIQSTLNNVNWNEIAEAYAKDYPFTGSDEDDTDDDE